MRGTWAVELWRDPDAYDEAGDVEAEGVEQTELTEEDADDDEDDANPRCCCRRYCFASCSAVDGAKLKALTELDATSGVDDVTAETEEDVDDDIACGTDEGEEASRG